MISDTHKTSIIKIRENEIPVWIYGDKNKDIIFFMHGFFRGFSEYIGDLPVRYLMRKYKVIAFDMPGFGYSKELRMDKLEFIKEIQNHFDKKIGILATSYGGLISLKYAYQYPKNVNFLIIAGMPFIYGPYKLFHLSNFFPYIKNKSFIPILREFSFLNSKNLQSIKAPVLFYYSNKDKWASIKMGERISKMLPNGSIFTVNNRSHGWLLHRIDETGFLKKIEDFISKSTS